MNKIKLKICLLCVMLFASFFVLAACFELKKECNSHNYGDWETTVAATCTSNGAQTRLCTKCGKKFEKEMPSLGHSYGDPSVVKESTCLQTGETQRICRNCGDIKSETIAKAEHVYEKNELGLDIYYENKHICGGEQLKWRFCAVCEEKVFVKTGTNGENAIWQHQWENTFATDIIATCTENGSKSRHCTFCDKKTDVTTITAGHNMVVSSSILPTCTEDGNIISVCTVCKETTSKIIQKIGHKFGSYTVTKYSNCTETGEEIATCSVCKEKDIRTVPVNKTVHIWGDATVIDFGSCKTQTNGKTETPCTLCGEKKYGTYLYKHNFAHNMLCKDCDAEKIEGKFKTQSYSGGYRITEYLSNNISNLRIPSVIGGLKVVAIHQFAFSKHTELEYIWLPETILEIGTGAFANCTSLKELYIPSNALKLGDAILNNCKSIQRLVLPYVGSSYTPDDAKYEEQSTNTLGSYFGTTSGEGLIAVTQQDYNFTGQIETTYYIPASLNTVYVHGYFLSLQGFKNCNMITSIYVGAMRRDSKTEIPYPTGAFIGGTTFFNCPAVADISLYGNSKIPLNIFYQNNKLSLNFNGLRLNNVSFDIFESTLR